MINETKVLRLTSLVGMVASATSLRLGLETASLWSYKKVKVASECYQKMPSTIGAKVAMKLTSIRGERDKNE